jgi:hypothetical protein
MQDSDFSDGRGILEDPEMALATFTALEGLADVTTDAILASSPTLDRARARRIAAERLWSAVARVVKRCEREADGEDSVLHDAAEDMAEWIERLPDHSAWSIAFDQARSELLLALGAA